jgi:CubicO group peptidase (beta-lactamase class C family)
MPNRFSVRSLRPGSPAEAGMDAARIELIRTRASEWVASGITPSLAVFAARRGVVVLNEAYGILRHGETTPLRTDSIFPLASITKSFTAAAVLRLADDGLVGLTRAAGDYIPALNARDKREILVADLLTHTSGIDDNDATLDAERIEAGRRDAAPGQHPLNAALIHAIGRAPLATKPGAAMRYANVNFLLLADLVRRVSGTTWARYIEEQLFQPLGMAGARIGIASAAREARLVTRELRPPPPFPPFNQIPPESRDQFDAIFHGGGGACGTAADVARFAQMLLNGGCLDGVRVLSEAAAAAMTRPQLEPGIPSLYSVTTPSGKRAETPIRGGSYGYGVFLFEYDRSPNFNGSLVSASAFGHTGATGCNYWADPERETVGVYLSVMPSFTPNGWYAWSGDLFMNLVQAAAVG